ncbi:MAG: beta-eliminating lyase-related protein [Alphaproteobacteria bacterium]
MGTGKDFTSDNAAGAAPAVIEAIAHANTGTALAYGDDPYTAKLQLKLAEIFEHDVTVLPMFTGTAANALALACLAPPFGAVFCHSGAHIFTSECGAPEFYTGGAKLIPIDGDEGRIDTWALEKALADLGRGVMHHFQPAALSLTHATESGTLYDPAQITELSAIAHREGLKVHMDGARLSNALAAQGVSPAEATWKSGVDVLSFGLTKNGGIAAEAVVFFDEALAAEARFRQKRAGQVASKMRFISVQLLALLEDGLWLALAAHANSMALRLAMAARAAGVEVALPAEINEIFLKLDRTVADRLRTDGFLFHPWDAEPAQGLGTYRFVASFATELADIDALIAELRRRQE